MCFRPLPREHTVEYEEDRGSGLVHYRESSPPTAERDLPVKIHGIGRSRSELQDLRKQFAKTRQRGLSALHGARDSGTAPPFRVSTDDNDPVGATRSARYAFDENRLAFLARFERHFPDPELRPLGEACAILAGLHSASDGGGAAKQAWLKKFCGLDDRSLAEAQADAATERNATREISDPVGENESSEHNVTIPNELIDFAPIYASYAAYCRRATAAPSTALSSSALARASQLSTWRRIVDTIVEQRFDAVSSESLAEARQLSARLGTLRLFDAKLGEIVKESVQGLRAGEGDRGVVADLKPSSRDRKSVV